jgi:NitT/TauT family transport system substrate-binding protein
MKMKKIYIIIITIAAAFFTSACGNKEEIKVLTPSGSPLVALGGIIDKYNIESVSGVDLIQSSLIKENSEYDVIIAPIVLGATLYNKETTHFKLEGILTTGNMYIISKEGKEIETINDLEGKDIIAYGENSNPGIILRRALGEINANITYLLSANQVFENLASTDEFDYALLAEPEIAKLKARINISENIINISEILESEFPFLPQAGIFINPNSKKSDIEEFINNLKNSIIDINNNPDEYVNTIKNKNNYFKTLGESILKSSIANMGITYINSFENIDEITDYFGLLLEGNQNLLGGKIPNEEFYYSYS